MYNEETSTGNNRKKYYLKDGIAVCGDKKHCLKFCESNRIDQPQFKTGAPAQSDRAAFRLRRIQASLSYIEKKPFSGYTSRLLIHDYNEKIIRNNSETS